jgi:hypothetical protein
MNKWLNDESVDLYFKVLAERDDRLFKRGSKSNRVMFSGSFAWVKVSFFLIYFLTSTSHDKAYIMFVLTNTAP